MIANRRHVIKTLAAAAGSALLPAHLLAQTQPSSGRVTRIIVPVPAGGLTDILARSLALRLGETMGQPFIVENKPGAASIIGTDYVLKQPADGSTMLLTWTAIVQNPLFYPTAAYDPVKDFVPVSRLGGISALLVVGSHVKANNLQEFIAFAKSAAQPLTYGTAGAASAANFYGEIMSRAAGITLVHVPYKGDTDMLPDLLNSRVDALFIQPVVVEPYIKDGRLKVIAVTGPKRISLMPQVLTFTEQGMPGIDDDRWFGIFMRSGTPQALVDRLASEIDKWIALPATQERMRTAAMEPGGGTSAEFTAAVSKSQQQWREIVKKVPLKPQ